MKLLIEIQDLTTPHQTKYQHYIDIPSGMHEALEQTKKLSGGTLYRYLLSEGTISFKLVEVTNDP